MAKNLAERHRRFPQLKLSESLVDNLFDVLVNQLDGTQGIHHVEAIRFHAREIEKALTHAIVKLDVLPLETILTHRSSCFSRRIGGKTCIDLLPNAGQPHLDRTIEKKGYIRED